MFAQSLIALAAVASFASAAPIKSAPAGWAYGYLEDYETYHIRYLALKCYDQKKTEFFQDCCRPLLSTETLADNRKSYCIPSDDSVAYVTSSLAAKAAGTSATPTASADSASESEYCESEESASSAAPTNAKVAAAYSSSSPAATSAAATAAAESKAGEQYLAPAPSSSSTTTTTKAAPSTTSTPAWTPTPTTAAPTTQAPAATQAPSNNGGETFTGGYATYFYQGGNAGACGQVHGDNEMIVAIDQARWGSSSFGGGSSTCGKWVTITNTNNGRSVSAMIADVCPTCTNGNSLDLSQGAFRAIASDSDGMVPISWHWN